ncbi:nicotinate phosphoribosyltransferase [Meredithblackwellia eburnea MCA 4105]
MVRITSILDTDLYKLTMQQAVLQHYPTALVSYRFTNRGNNSINKPAFEAIKEAVAHLGTLSLTSEERTWLESKCPYFTPTYLDFLQSFTLNPMEEVHLVFEPEGETTDAEGNQIGKLSIEIKGSWVGTILYEVPLMAIVSEAYFTHVNTSWDYVGQVAQAKLKGKQLFEAGCLVSEFGTRRRRSFLSHDLVMKGLTEVNKELGAREDIKGKLSGTSNVYLAMKYDVLPIGTIAHEWIMGIAAIEGYNGANGRAMDLWEATYPSGALSIALTDTFSTKPFFEDFVSNPERGCRWKGLRQDSGDPSKFIPIAKEAFERVGADPKSKLIVFSDGLDVPRCIKLKQEADAAGIGCSFGVGTTFTNDYKNVEAPVKQDNPGEGEIRTEGGVNKALNMVIKLYKINNEFCVKISDELTKNTGDAETVRLVKMRFGLETA